MNKNVWLLGLGPRPRWGNLQRSPDSIAGGERLASGVESIRGFAHAAGFAAARRCLRFLVTLFVWFREAESKLYGARIHIVYRILSSCSSVVLIVVRHIQIEQLKFGIVVPRALLWPSSQSRASDTAIIFPALLIQPD